MTDTTTKPVSTKEALAIHLAQQEGQHDDQCLGHERFVPGRYFCDCETRRPK